MSGKNINFEDKKKLKKMISTKTRKYSMQVTLILTKY